MCVCQPTRQFSHQTHALTTAMQPLTHAHANHTFYDFTTGARSTGERQCHFARIHLELFTYSYCCHHNEDPHEHPTSCFGCYQAVTHRWSSFRSVIKCTWTWKRQDILQTVNSPQNLLAFDRIKLEVIDYVSSSSTSDDPQIHAHMLFIHRNCYWCRSTSTQHHCLMYSRMSLVS